MISDKISTKVSYISSKNVYFLIKIPKNEQKQKNMLFYLVCGEEKAYNESEE